MDRRSRERKVALQAIKLSPVDSRFLAASLQSFEPHPLNQLVELVQRPAIEDEAVIAVVTAQYLAQPGMLLSLIHI